MRRLSFILKTKTVNVLSKQAAWAPIAWYSLSMFDTTKDLKAINDIVNADLIKLTDLEYANKL